MSERRKKTGRVLETGKITAGQIAGALGLGGPEPEVRAPKLTPAQQRAKDEGKPLPPSPPDFETTVIAGGRDAYDFLGAPDLASAESHIQDGRPVAAEPPPKAQPQRADWDAVDDGPPKLDAAEAKLDAAKPDPRGTTATVVAQVKAHAARARASFEAARGTPREADAIASLNETTKLVERATAKL